jgi:protein-disulfide isomerase
MASHAEQKAFARVARKAAQQEQIVARTRRRRLFWLGGLGGAVAAGVAVVIALGPGGSAAPTKRQEHSAVSTVSSLIAGIPQAGTVLGNPKARVTVTEYADIVCSVCDDFALTSEQQLIATEVRSGHVKLIFRGLETASSFANGAAYTDTQVAIRSAGMQDRAWDYILLAFAEQPHTIGGADAEQVTYVTSAYLQRLASQVPGLDLVRWQTGMTNPTLIDDVTADTQAAHAAGVTGTPAIIVSGPAGSVFYDRNADPGVSVVPSLATLQQLIAQVS